MITLQESGHQNEKKFLPNNYKWINPSLNSTMKG